MIASTFTWIFKIVVTCLVAFVAVWYWGQRVSTVGDSMSPVLKNADVVLVNRIVYLSLIHICGQPGLFRNLGFAQGYGIAKCLGCQV